jgi:uncharacterized RDD family membrane protein YckC
MGDREPGPSAEPSLPNRALGAGARGARRVARATGIEGTAEAIAEEAIVRAIESRAAERALSRVLQGPALEDAVEHALESPAVERALNRAIESEMTDRVWAQLLESDEVQKLVERIAEAPEVRAAIAAQGVGFLNDLGRALARTTHRLDDVAEAFARRLLRRPRREGPAEQAGLVSRGLALVLDGAILNGAFLALSALIALVASLFIDGDPAAAPTLAIGTGLWLAVGTGYLVFFWTLAGQTPGMRFLRIRLEAAGELPICTRRAFRRLVGIALSAAALGLGFLAVLVEQRRRGWADRIAGTEVLYASTAPRPAPWSGRGEESRVG